MLVGILPTQDENTSFLEDETLLKHCGKALFQYIIHETGPFHNVSIVFHP